MYVSVLVYRRAETYADDVETLLQKDVTNRQTDGQRTFTRLFIKYRIQTIGIHGVYTQSDSPEGITQPVSALWPKVWGSTKTCYISSKYSWWTVVCHVSLNAMPTGLTCSCSVDDQCSSWVKSVSGKPLWLRWDWSHRFGNLSVLWCCCLADTACMKNLF